MLELKQYDLENLVYIDEMGVDQNTIPDRGWAPMGERSYAETIGGKTKRLSVVAGFCMASKSTIGEFEYSGTMNQDLFVGWFENVLLPELKPGGVIILDNARVHKSPEIYELAEQAQCRVIFLPPYSPDLNPIEKFWANLKRAIKAVIRRAESFEAAITMGFKKTLSG